MLVSLEKVLSTQSGNRVEALSFLVTEPAEAHSEGE
jgi:hypothetical protein